MATVCPENQPLPELSGYAFWLIPDEKSSVWLKSEIKRLSKKYRTPPFEPHITAGSHKGEIDITDLNQLERKIESQMVFSLSTDKLICSDAPYQNITISLKSSPSVHELAKYLAALFGKKPIKQEFHLSLLYGNIPCKDLQEDLRKLTVQLPNFFKVNRLWLVSINGEPKDWKLQQKLFFLPDSQE